MCFHLTKDPLIWKKEKKYVDAFTELLQFCYITAWNMDNSVKIKYYHVTKETEEMKKFSQGSISS